MDNQQELNEAEDMIFSLRKEIARLTEALNVGVPILEEAANRIEQLESNPMAVGYVCNGCEVPCRLDTCGKPFDTETAVCFLDGVRTGTDWKTLK